MNIVTLRMETLIRLEVCMGSKAPEGLVGRSDH